MSEAESGGGQGYENQNDAPETDGQTTAPGDSDDETATTAGDEALAAVDEDTAAEPGQEAGAEPGDDAAAEPGDDAAAEPGDDTGTEPGEDAAVIEMAEVRLEARAAAETGGDGEGAPEEAVDDERVPFDQLEGVIESLLFASDRPLGIEDLKGLTGETETATLTAALEALRARRLDTGVEVAEVAGGYTLRTRAAFAFWVSKLLAGRPVRLSRAMLETVAIIAYRQPITRPELDDIRGVDCGPVLKTLLDRGLIRIIGKKEEVGRPILYGTTPEFLRVFSLKDLTQLPTLRQFHELSAEHQATLEAKHGPDPGASAAAPPPVDPAGVPSTFFDPGPPPIAPADRDPRAVEADADEDAGLLDELESASEAAASAARPLHSDGGEAPGESS